MALNEDPEGKSYNKIEFTQWIK